MMFLDLLLPWIKTAQKELYQPMDRQDLKCFGTGHNSWGVQTNQKAFASFAVATKIASDSELNAYGLSRNQLISDALCMLRYSLQTHIEGDYHCIDEEKWGHTWISGLGLTRMMHGVEAIKSYLTPEDMSLLEKVLISEADWLLNCYTVTAGLIQNNRPESNIWNGTVLYTAAMYFPHAVNYCDYLQKADIFFKNGVSLLRDKGKPEVIDGNFFDSFALHHHGYMNVGYMYICLSGIANLYFLCKDLQITPPESLYTNIEGLWRLCKSLTFADGRLWRIGGDTRVRYCYCQDYALPVWIFASKYFRDGCTEKINKWLEQVKIEMNYNQDGTYLSKRCKKLKEKAPLYYSRLESDRAFTISQAAYWRNKYGLYCGIQKKDELAIWYDEYHGSTFVKNNNRRVSFVWRGAEGPVATCVPRDGSNLVEWRHNLVGDIRGGGAINDDLVVSHSTSLFENGFITYGEADCKSEFFMEGHPNEVYARKKIAYAALPDGKTTLTLQIAIAKRRTYIDSIKGLHLNIPNDIYNGMSRTYYTDQGVFEVKNAVNIEGLQRLYVEGLGIVALNGSLTLFHPAERQVEITKRACHDTRDSGGILWCDEILTVKRVEKMWVEKDEILYDDVIALICGSEDDTINLQKHARPVHLGPDIRAAVARGADKKDYIMLFNISQSEKEVQIDSGNPDHYLIDLASLENVHSKDNSFYIRVPASTAKIYCCAGIGE